MGNWKYPILLISGIGISNLGNWIYLIAINISILNLTGSAAAVAGLYVIRPIAILLTNTWAGSLIDRVNKRRVMITVDIIRGILIFVIPFMSSLWSIYSVLLLISIAGAFFGPSSSVYITKLVPSEHRKRFNSLMSMTGSGAFLAGPAIAGLLIMSTSTDICIFINAVTFLLCALVIFFLPNVDTDLEQRKEPIRLPMLMNDYRVIADFAKEMKYFMLIYFLFQMTMLINFSLDSQEATFIKTHLLLSDQSYGLIVSLTGAGALAGAACGALFANKLSIRLYLGVGMLFTQIGYLLFYLSEDFITATLSFVFLGFFMSFGNTGYTTFYQKNVPVSIMGRFGSLAELIQAAVQIILTLLVGAAAELFSLQLVCFLFAATALGLAIVLLIAGFNPSKSMYYDDNSPSA